MMREYITWEYRKHPSGYVEGLSGWGEMVTVPSCNGCFGDYDEDDEGYRDYECYDCADAKKKGIWNFENCDCTWVLKNISKEGVNKVVDYITSGDMLELGTGLTNKELSYLKHIRDYTYVPKDSRLYEGLIYIVSHVLHVLYPEYDGCIDSKLEHKVCDAVIKYYL